LFLEFLVAISVISHGDIRKKLEIAFDIYDINKNGKIDRKEITKLIEEIYDLTGEDKREGANAPVEKMKAIMAQLG
jgi:Ca2+-binding EF-hand superfamily protein